MQAEKVKKPVTAARSLTKRHRRAKPEKWTAVSLYVNELLYHSKTVNADVESVIILPNGFPQVGPGTMSEPPWITHLIETGIISVIR